jgi:transposase
MKAYSMDLRERVVAACDAGGATREQVADRFSVSVRWVRALLRRRRETGSIAPRPRGGGRAAAFDGAAEARLREAVRADDDATLGELARAAGVAWRAAPRRCTGHWPGWASPEKKVAAGGRAGPS